MKISALIIDDEPLARQRLENLLIDIVDIEILDRCKNGKEAIRKIEEYRPDLIFLDIQLKDMSGFEVLERINVNKRPLIIFVTAYDEFALKAFDYFAFDYLLKPFRDDRFYSSTRKIIDYIKQNKYSQFDEKIENLLNFIKKPGIELSQTYKSTIPIKLGNKISFIDVNDITYITASGYYAEIHVESKKHLLRESLTNLINGLDEQCFIRIHRSTIINLKYIQEVISSSYGEMDVKMKNGQLFRISKAHKKEFVKRIGI